MFDVINCPQCRRSLRLPENHFGKLVQCPSCRTSFSAEPSIAELEPADDPVIDAEPAETSPDIVDAEPADDRPTQPGASAPPRGWGFLESTDGRASPPPPAPGRPRVVSASGWRPPA